MKVPRLCLGAAFLGVSLLVASCRSTTSPGLSLHVSGVVTTFAGAPIIGAKVVLETMEIPYLLLASARLDSALTDTQGRFAVSYVNQDMKCISIYRLHATADNNREVFTNDASGNSIQCTSQPQTINLKM